MSKEPATKERRPSIEEKTRAVYRGARYSSIGLELGVSVVIGMAMGYWVDSKFETEPIGLLAGMGLGFVAAFRSIRRTLKILEAEEKQANDQRDPP